LLIPVGVGRSGEIASPDCYQARNDVIGLFARNDEMGLFARNDVVGLRARDDAPFVIARSEATKQSPRCSFLLVLGILGGLLRLIVIRLAMTKKGCSLAMTPLSVIARAQPEAISSLHLAVLFYKNSLLTRCNAFISEGLAWLKKNN
jgi:hypothetical protein